MKNGYNGEAMAAVNAKISSVESEQGSPKSVGSEPPDNFGHGSAKSAGVGGQIPVGSGGDSE